MKLRLLLLVLLCYFHGQAQTKKISGDVRDANSKSPLAGASITIPGTKLGTTTDASGHFSITVPETIDFIEVSMLNYQLMRVGINGMEPISIALNREQRGMDEVIVVGYGTQKKRDLTGAVATIGSKDVGGRQTVQVSEALQGSIAGVSVTRNSAQPGASSSILIRGITTIGTNNPLVIVDGMPVSSIDNVNPNDVENLTVLKDAASAAIYGSRGAAGVILVTTKRGRNGQGSLEYNFEYGIQKATASPEYVGVLDYMRYFNEQSINDGAATGPYSNDYINGYLDSNRVNPDRFPNTDWKKSLLTNELAPRVRHDLVFAMGTGKLKTKASLGYSKTGAFYDHFNYERYQFRVNNDLQISEKLTANLDVAYRRVNSQSPNASPIYDSRVIPAIYGDYYRDGRYSIGKDGRNPVAQLHEGGFDNSYFNQVLGRLFFSYKPLKGLTLSAQVAPTYDFDQRKQFSTQIKFTNPDGSNSNVVNQARTILNETRTDNFSINGQFLVNYTRDFNDDHHFDVLAGYEENYNSYEYLAAGRSGFPLDIPYLNAGSAELRTNEGAANNSSLHSFFGRLQYNFREKYFLQGNLRYDQSSRFGPDYRNALFPSLSVGWTLSEEKFMRRFKWLDFMKVRASWGEAGNERLLDKDGNPAYYPYQSTLVFSNALFYQGNSVVPRTGAGQQVYAVENITWETSRTANIGIDLAFFRNRFSISADYYEKKTFDILLPLDIPLYIGYDKPNQNAGVLNVKGWELEMAWRDRVGKLTYSIAANLSDARSKVGDLKGTQFLGDQVIREGSEYNEWFGYVSNGLFQTAEEVGKGPVFGANTKPGDVRYVDMNKDGVITPDDKVLLGGALPRYQYGGTLRLDYNGFDFGLSFQGVAKKQSRLQPEIVQPFAEAFGNMSKDMVGKFWSVNNSAEQNLHAVYPRLSRTSNANNYALSDFWLISGSYFRLKNITFGYTMKQDILKKAGMQSLRLYVAANDLFSFSKFPKYLDPESANYAYPIVTTIMGGVTVKF